MKIKFSHSCFSGACVRVYLCVIWSFIDEKNEAVVHDVYVDKNSKLYEVFNSDVINVNSVHNYMVTEVGNDFRVSIKSSDDVIEGIEYINDDNFVVGVQFHPEI